MSRRYRTITIFPAGTDRGYTAVVRRHGGWWIGWVDEVEGVNSQGETREVLIENLGSALTEALEW